MSSNSPALIRRFTERRSPWGAAPNPASNLLSEKVLRTPRTSPQRAPVRWYVIVTYCVSGALCGEALEFLELFPRGGSKRGLGWCLKVFAFASLGCFFWKGLDKEGISLYNKRCYGESVDLETPKRWRLPPPIPEDAKISFLPSDNSEGR